MLIPFLPIYLILIDSFPSFCHSSVVKVLVLSLAPQPIRIAATKNRCPGKVLLSVAPARHPDVPLGSLIVADRPSGQVLGRARESVILPHQAALSRVVLHFARCSLGTFLLLRPAHPCLPCPRAADQDFTSPTRSCQGYLEN